MTPRLATDQLKTDDRLLSSQSVPALRNDHGIAGIGGVVADGGGDAEPTGLQVDPLAKVGDVLGGFVGDAGHVVVIDQERGGALWVLQQFLDVNYGSIGDAADFAEQVAPLALDRCGCLRFAAKQRITGNAKGDASR